MGKRPRSRFSASRLYLPVIILTVLGFFTTVSAEDGADDQLAAATEELKKNRKRVVSENLNLNEQEARMFWPVYEKYERDLFVIGEKRRLVIAKFGENYESMTDAMAKQIMMDRIILDEEHNQLRRRYLAQFEKVLPMKKVARYYQIERKIRAAIDAGIAQELPLIQ